MPRAFPHQLAWLLDNPLRRLLLSPQTLLSRIPLRPTDRILELGPGSGYFSGALAAAVPRGHLELVEVQEEMLAKARAALEGKHHTNVGYTWADAGKPLRLAPGSFDAAILVCVLGEVGDRTRCLENLARLIKPAGLLVIHEGWPDPDRIPLPVLRTQAEAHGFVLEQVHGPRWNRTAVFRRTSS